MGDYNSTCIHAYNSTASGNTVSKKNSLSLALESRPLPRATAALPAVAREEATPKTAKNRPPSRQGKKLIGAHFAPEVSRVLNVISAENDKGIQELLAEGLNLIFAKYGKPQIATLEPKR